MNEEMKAVLSGTTLDDPDSPEQNLGFEAARAVRHHMLEMGLDCLVVSQRLQK